MVLGGGVGRGRSRGRGRGKTQLWEWESYKPGPNVYQQLWRIRKEPAIVTASPSEECPIQHAQTRILSRKQTEGAIVRNYYVVQITRTDDGATRHDTEDVDLSRILQYVSPAELERFENEQFRLEAEAEAVAVRAEIRESARRRLQVNRGGRGRGRIVSTPELPAKSQPRARGRPRGRRGRGRLGSRGLGLRGYDTGEQPEVDSDVLVADDEESHRVIPETPSQPSPGLLRSAFVANSALPVSPIHRRFSTSTTHRSSVNGHGSPMFSTQQDQDSDEDDHHIKRLRVESSDSPGHTPLTSTPQIPTEAFAQAVLFSDRSSAIELDSSPYATPGLTGVNSLSLTKPTVSLSPAPEHNSSMPARTPSDAFHDTVIVRQPLHNEEPNNNNDTAEDEDEYVVESILEHYDDGQKTYYLVKWEGYEDGHDWLPEEDLGGARELVTEYKKRIGHGKVRKKKGQFFN